MFDIKWIRENPEAFDGALKRRGQPAQAAELLALDEKRRLALTRAQEAQARRNKLARDIGAAKAKGEDAGALLAEVARDKDVEAELQAEADRMQADLAARLALAPNAPAPDVPDGKDETANKEIRRWGEPKKFDFRPREHFEIGEGLGLMDFERAAKISGARFVVLKGALARLERALASFMLDLHTTEFGYTEINPPALVSDTALFGTGNLPKFGADLFHTETGLWLIPTAEVPLTNLVANEIVDEDKLPMRMTAMTWCFRSEAGAAGKDTRGMIRQHQFTKVELVSVAHPDASEDEHQRMTNCAEEVLRRLGLPFRTVVLCSGDMGFSARKTHDIEVWLPGQDRYREISSCSNCGDFQARRMKARFKAKGEKGTRFVHTLNGSGIAVGRALVAILENYQQADGSVRVPDALKPYMGGLDVIRPAGA
ncbi:MAG: serine--tRNA ligase [Alphaproteobacteria bacterium]|nr:serine--tRNA ligase [Alphaproteobacteria bacterium]